MQHSSLFLYAAALDPASPSSRSRRLDSTRFRQLRQKLAIASTVLRRTINRREARASKVVVSTPTILPTDQSVFRQYLQDPAKKVDRVSQLDQSPRSRYRRMVRRRFRHFKAQEVFQAQRICTSPCESTLRVDAFNVPDHPSGKTPAAVLG